MKVSLKKLAKMSSPYPQQGYPQQPMMNNTTVINNSPAQGKVSNQSDLFVGISHPTEKIPIPGIKKSPGYPEEKKDKFSRDFFWIFWIFSSFSNSDPDPRDFGIFQSGFFRDFKIPILIPEVSRFSEFFDLALNKKSQSRKNPILKRTLLRQ